jgi:hypothetical protein
MKKEDAITDGSSIDVPVPNATAMIISSTRPSAAKNATSTVNQKDALSRNNKKHHVIVIHCCISLIIAFLFLALETIIQANTGRKGYLHKDNNDGV